MQSVLDFGLRHWELSLAFIVILVYWIVSEYLEHSGGHGVSPEQLVHLMNREHGVVVDLRDASHFEAGHIMGALSFPEKELLENINKLKKYQSKPLILVDKNGSASSKLLNQVIGKGYTHTRYLKNGMQAWVQAKMPLDKGKNNGKN